MSSMKSAKLDIPFLISTLLLFVIGLLIFFSASFGLLAKQKLSYGDIVLKQLIIGGGIGMLALVFTSNFDYKKWRKYAFYLFLFGIFLNLIVFIPQIGYTHGGATRWISLWSFTFQPSEFLRLATVLYFSV